MASLTLHRAFIESRAGKKAEPITVQNQCFAVNKFFISLAPRERLSQHRQQRLVVT